MKFRTLTITLGIIVLIGATSYFLFRDFFDSDKKSAKEYSNIPDIKCIYNVEQERLIALKKLNNNQQQAQVINHLNANRSIGVTFDGIANEADTAKILDILTANKIAAVFFIGNLQTVETPQVVQNILQHGQQVGSYLPLNKPNSTNIQLEKLIGDISLNRKVIRSYTNKDTLLIKTADAAYTTKFLQVAAACGLEAVVKPTIVVNPLVLQTKKEAEIFVRSLRSGSIISLKLSIDEPATEAKRVQEVRAEMEKKPGLKQVADNNVRVDMVLAINNLAAALNSEKIAAVPIVVETDKSQKKNSLVDKLAGVIREFTSVKTAYAAERNNIVEELKYIHTTEPALAFTFGELSDPVIVDKVLKKLQDTNIRGTFFIAEIEMLRQADSVRKIIAGGHELGIVIRPKDNATLQETKELIVRSQRTLSSRFGVQSNLIKQPWGKITDTTKQAIAELNCVLVGQSINLVQTKHRDYATARQVMQAIFKPSMDSLRRGEIIYFRMNFYQNKDLIVDLIADVKKYKVDNIAYNKSFDNIHDNSTNDSAYSVKPVGEIINNKHYIYQYPINMDNVPEYLRGDIYDQGVNEKNLLQEFTKRYIGNSTVDKDDRIMGFSEQEMRRFDRPGLIHTDENVVFISFDDWSTDAAANKILYVLRKHKVKATFFILTKNMLNNVNLLRSIAVEGHDISSHSEEHKAMVFTNAKGKAIMQPRTKGQAIEDYRTAHVKLRDVVGDVQVDGRYVLNRDFRPPTLAFSRDGVEALFAVGTEYIINGSYSTQDYMANDIPELVSGMRQWLYNPDGSFIKGSIIVMHISDPAGCTAVALDILLTANERKADNDPSKFKVGLMSEYLRNGYKQVDYNKLPPKPIVR